MASYKQNVCTTLSCYEAIRLSCNDKAGTIKIVKISCNFVVSGI